MAAFQVQFKGQLCKIQDLLVVRNMLQNIFSDTSCDFRVSTRGSQYLDHNFIQLKPFQILVPTDYCYTLMFHTGPLNV